MTPRGERPAAPGFRRRAGLLLASAGLLVGPALAANAQLTGRGVAALGGLLTLASAGLAVRLFRGTGRP